MKKIWAEVAGVVLALILMAVGLGYLADEPDKSPWIAGAGGFLVVAGTVLFVKYVRRLRS
ncbi:hypothetical protein [Streptomyces sp. NPDC096152]|uniref:hypothetical protein n=1 Tax=Streptomyces sp. NPDC096152 TaxID=3366078 RepID=UPI0038208FC9